MFAPSRTLRLFDKTGIEANQEQDEMGEGAEPIDFGRQDKIGDRQRHRHVGKVEIELNSRADKEYAGQKIAKIAAAPCETKCR